MDNQSGTDSKLEKLQKGLRDVGDALFTPPSQTHQLLCLLDKTENLLSKVAQDVPFSFKVALLPLLEALASKSLLGHLDVNVKVSVVSCIVELSRISAPDQLYTNEVMMEIFKLVVLAFEKLTDTSDRYYSKAVNILKNTSKLKFFNVLLDLECEELIIQIFQLFFSIISFNHKDDVLGYMEDIMKLILEGTEDISLELLKPIVASLSRENKNEHSMKLGTVILRNCAVKLKPYLQRAVSEFNYDLDDYVEVTRSICEGEFDVPNEQRRRPEERPDSKHRNVSDIEDGKPEVETAAVPQKKALKKPASDNSAAEKKISIVIQTKGKKDQLLHQLKGMKQSSDNGTSEKHVTTDEDNTGKAKDKNNSEEGTKTKGQSKPGLKKEEESKKRKAIKRYGEELVDLRIKVWWPMDKRFYEGVVRSFDPVKMKHKVLYLDGEEENLNLNKERWKLVDQEQDADVQGPNPK
ncbi:chromatin/chromatin-binding, or -regulatory protein [Lithospermum erythrorhizon]|uniref:Chromatin/chromatin-binding, or -regulatory protein n=1 Tax=Lithospermum erythrorhizon TaxID=34254 RepID=A0AAV3R5N3_LITER